MTLEKLDEFYQNQPEPLKSSYFALREIILSYDEKLTETMKYGMPCFCFQNKAFCYLWKDKTSGFPYVLFVDGKLLNHPALEQGSRAKMKIFSINPSEDIPIEVLNSILKENIELRNSK